MCLTMHGLRSFGIHVIDAKDDSSVGSHVDQVDVDSGLGETTRQAPIVAFRIQSVRPKQ